MGALAPFEVRLDGHLEYFAVVQDDMKSLDIDGGIVDLHANRGESTAPSADDCLVTVSAPRVDGVRAKIDRGRVDDDPCGYDDACGYDDPGRSGSNAQNASTAKGDCKQGQ